METVIKPAKPLNRKAYGHIGHLPGSRMGPGDHHCDDGQTRICTTQTRKSHRDRVIVTEKLDGTNVAAARIEGQIIALIRAGYPARTSPYPMHNLFADWVEENRKRFEAILFDGEWANIEWLAQAHGSLYQLHHEPAVIFDMMAPGANRLTWDEIVDRSGRGDFINPDVITDGSFFPVEAAEYHTRRSTHGAIGPAESAVWRVETNGRFNFMAKWVRPDKQDGKYLPEISGKPPIWLWGPNYNLPEYLQAAA